jgi:hypothetical protein
MVIFSSAHPPLGGIALFFSRTFAEKFKID